MKNPTARILLRAMLFALLVASALVIFGFVQGWKSYTQFSDVFFLSGAALISLGVLSNMGGYTAAASTQYSESMSRLDSAERSRRWVEDTVQSHRILVFLATAGLLLLGFSALAIVIGRMF